MVLKGKPLVPPEYQRMQALMTAGNVIRLKHVAGFFVDKKVPPVIQSCDEDTCRARITEMLKVNETERFRYPPRPPTEQGFTVFGPLRELRLADAEGAFSTLDHPLLAPTDMNLRDVDVIGPSGEAEIPVPAAQASENLDISASGKSTVAGAELVPGRSFNISLALLAAGVIIGVLGLYFGAASWFGERRPAAPDGPDGRRG